MSSRSPWSGAVSTFHTLLRRKSTRETISSVATKSSTRSRNQANTDDTSTKRSKRQSSYISYAVYNQTITMFTIILRDPDATQKLLESILDSPNGKRAVSRLARTCRALLSPALNVLWRELDSLVPIIGLFPTSLLKKARKPGLGLVRSPVEDDWNKILRYGERVQRITYDESANNVSASIFPVFENHRPRTYILPNLLQLNWRVETPAGLDRCALFLNPDLRGVSLEIGTKFPQLTAFLTDMSSRIHLTSLSFISPTTLPESFTELLLPQDSLEKLVLVAPGALSPRVGRWVASLPQLKSLQLDLTGRSMIAVEGFFDELRPRSGDSTPSSPGSTDSGVFSGDELDFSDIRKSALRLTGDLRSKGSFAQMRQLQLTGEASNIAVFLKHLTSPLTQLEIVIEDPPDKADWQDLSAIICDRFGNSLQSLRVAATGSSRFSELVRTTSRGESIASSHLSLEYFTSLPQLIRLDIDLPDSIIFVKSDIMQLAKAAPNLEVLKLCPVARFSSATGSPKLTLDALAPLISSCQRLHTLAVVIHAKQGSADVLGSWETSSRSLLRLHVGHSWVTDPLQVTILLSHFAPHLETLKWFHEKNRPGFVEANATGWQQVSDYLPHLQNLRLAERQAATQLQQQQHEQVKAEVHIRPPTSDKSIDATVTTSDRGVQVRPHTMNRSAQVVPSLVSRMVQAQVDVFSISIDATPLTAEAEIDASPSSSDQSVDARPLTSSTGVDATMPTLSRYIDATVAQQISEEENDDEKNLPHHPFQRYNIFPSIFNLLSLACHIFISYPLSIPYRIFELSFAKLRKKEKLDPESGKKLPSGSAFSSPSSQPDIPLDNLTSPLQQDPYVQGTIHELIHEPRDEAKDEYKHELEGQPPVQSKLLDETDIFKRLQRHLVQIDTNKLIEETRHAKLHKPDSSAYTPWNFVMSDNKKQERDFTPEVDALIPEVTTIAKAGNLQEALDKLFILEKQTRNVSDLASTTRLVKTISQLCYEGQDFTLLNSSITTLSKKHGQLKAAVQVIVEQAMGWLEDIKKSHGTEKWLELVETLRGVTEGKIFLETPRARVTLLLSHYHEGLAETSLSTSPASSKTSLQTASDLLSDLQVETYSSMERREKTEFILEQMRLLIAVARQKDAESGKDGKDPLGGGEAEWVKVRVGGRKVNEEFLKDKANEDLKLKYYELMIQHALNGSAYLDVAKYYYKVWETPSIKEDEADKGKAALEHIVYYVVLAPHNNEQSDMLHHLFLDPALVKLELHYNLVKCFVTRELMRWPGIETIYGPFLRTTPVFTADKRWEDLHIRVIEHNIRVVAQYYTRITLPRLTSLLDLTPKQTEETLARLVVSGTVWARIDRPAGIVNFRSKRSAEDVMNDWSSDMQKLLGLVEKTWMGMNAAQAAQSRVKA